MNERGFKTHWIILSKLLPSESLISNITGISSNVYCFLISEILKARLPEGGSWRIHLDEMGFESVPRTAGQFKEIFNITVQQVILRQPPNLQAKEKTFSKSTSKKYSVHKFVILNWKINFLVFGMILFIYYIQ